MSDVDPIELTVVSVEGDPDRPSGLVLRDDAGTEYRVTIPRPGTSRPEPAQATQLGMAVTEMTPREIQQAIRSGMSATDLVDRFGVDPERVRRYEGPVLQERAHIAERAHGTVLRRSEGSRALRDLVIDRLAERGDDPESLEWDAWRREDGRWTLQATWLALGSDIGEDSLASAHWIFDNVGRTVAPDDAAARGLVEARTPEPPRPAPTRASAGGDPYEATPDPLDDLTALADATAPTVVIERPAAPRPGAEPAMPPTGTEDAPSPAPAWRPVVVDGGRTDEPAEPVLLHDLAQAHEPSRPQEEPLVEDVDDWTAPEPQVASLEDLPVEDEPVEPTDDHAAHDAVEDDLPVEQDPVEDAPADVVIDGDHLDDTAPLPRSSSGRRRTSVPSWDEILFGSTPAGRDPDQS